MGADANVMMQLAQALASMVLPGGAQSNIVHILRYLCKIFDHDIQNRYLNKISI